MRAIVVSLLLVLGARAASADPAAPVVPVAAEPPVAAVPPVVAADPVVPADPAPDTVPWYRGPDSGRRILHLSVTVAFAAAFVLSETVFQTSLAPSACRWCDPPGFDRSVRNALVWHNTDRANTLSTIDAYALAPAVGLTLLYISDADASWRRLLDDTIPVFETVAVSQVFVNIVKDAVARQRPYAHFAAPGAAATLEDNVSFMSGHSALGFGITASAGMICHWHHYWTEPYVWGVGIFLSLSTEYLRMAADKHYLSDVVTGGLVGLGFGLTIPRLMRYDVHLVPTATGAAVVGAF